MKETVIRLSSFWQLSGKKLLTVHGAVHHASRGVFPDSCQRFWWHGVNSFLFAVIGLFQRFCSIYFDFFFGTKGCTLRAWKKCWSIMHFGASFDSRAADWFCMLLLCQSLVGRHVDPLQRE